MNNIKQIKEQHGTVTGYFQSLRADYLMSGKGHWGDYRWHLEHRLTGQEDIDAVFPEIGEAPIKLPENYQFSFLPLNLFVGHEARQKFIPLDYKFGQHPTGRMDPYGIFQPNAMRLQQETYIGSQKFAHTLLVNLSVKGKTLFCPIGCASCYKGEFTKEGQTEERFTAPVEQIRLLAEWLRDQPEVYDIILSGGEPLMITDEQLEQCLNFLAAVKTLKLVRICTGTLFLGLPFRLTDQLLESLVNFQKAGKQITFQAHLAHPDNFTPEAIQAVKKIKSCGLEINSQIPILESVNFFRDDQDKTIKLWEELGWLQVKYGIRPYKYLPDVHARTDQFFVPLELILKVLVKQKEGHEFPDLFWPTNFTIMTPAGNIPLQTQMLLTMKKQVLKQEDKVIYRIPATWLGGQWLAYEEPLLVGYNDQPKIN